MEGNSNGSYCVHVGILVCAGICVCMEVLCVRIIGLVSYRELITLFSDGVLLGIKLINAVKGMR